MRVPHFLPTPADDDFLGVIPAEPFAFPFPIKGEYAATLDTPVDLSWRPIQISVSKGVKWWWRVKKWKMTIEGVDVNGFTAQELVLEPETVANELELCDWFNRTGGLKWVLPFPGQQTITIGGGTLQITDPQLFYLGQGFVGIPAYQMSQVVSPDTSDFIPTMGFYCDVNWDNGLGVAGQYIGQSYDNTAANDHDTATTIDGETFTVRFSFFAGDDFGSIALSLEPAEYWDYRDADNLNPIWDDETGAQLRSVLTGEEL